MSRDVLIHETARFDILDAIDYIDEHAPDITPRFRAELQHVFDRLADFPNAGPPCPAPHYPDLRRIILPELPFSVFYRATASAIEVYRVAHHARDLAEILALL